MSRTDGSHSSLPFGNPFRHLFSRRSNISSNSLFLLQHFELMLSRRLTNLIPKHPSQLFSLAWLSQAAESLSDIHTNVKALITDLQFPVSDWDNRWIDAYLNDSIKVLDICIVLSSELSRLNHCQFLLQHFLHTLNPSGSLTCEPLERSDSSLRELIAWFRSWSPSLNHSYDILQNLAQTLLYIGEGKKSSKEKALMRALYGVKVITIFLCGVIIAVLSGCSNSKPLIQMRVPEKFTWSNAFTELCGIVASEIGNRFSSEKMTFLEELKAVETCAERLHAFACAKEVGLSSLGNEHGADEILLDGKEEGRKLQESVSDLVETAEKLFEGVDVLSIRVDDFFRIVLSGRDALLADLRVGEDTR